MLELLVEEYQGEVFLVVDKGEFRHEHLLIVAIIEGKMWMRLLQVFGVI